MNSLVLSAIAVIGIVGITIGVLLGIASIVLAVKVDERVQKIYDSLPHFNCGACGFPGCQGMAEGLIKSAVPISNCKPSKPDRRQLIKEILDEYGIENKL